MQKKIADYPDYSVTDGGRIVSHKHGKDRTLRPAPDHGGYLHVQLHDHGRHRIAYLHREVIKAFKGRPDGCLDINHLDGNKRNNHIENLEWVTRSENMLHAYRLGLMADKNGEQNGRAKVTSDQVQEIRRMLKEGARQKDIGAKFGLHQSHISRIARNESWGEVK